MKKLLIIMSIFPIIGFSQAVVEWANYPGGVAAAADASNNVYSPYWDYNPAGDITLTKRNAAGTILWEVSYNNTNNSRHEVATWVETDSQNNILVSGTIRSGYSNPVNANSLLMKYDPSGNLLWRVVYETDFDGSSTTKCLVDAQDNIYVLGLGHSGTGMVAKVKKFSPSGTALWSYFDNAGIGRPVNFKFTPDNCIVISARSIYGILSGYAKIDLNGNPIWSLTGISSLSAGDIAGAEAGNSYIVYSNTIKKLNPAGGMLWEKTNTNLTCFRVEVGSDNSAVISGYPASGVGAAFVKYNSIGNLLWENLDADGPGYNLLAHGQMKLDASNAAYLAASIMTNMAICKVNIDGTSAWTVITTGGYAYNMDFGTDNSVFVGGGNIARIIQGTHTTVSLKAYLVGPLNGNEMNNLLNTSGNLPLSHPYYNAPWFYTGTESVASIPNLNVVDWILVELRETAGNAASATPDKIVLSQAGFILKNGIITGLDGVNPLQFNLEITDNLYVVLWHRNHTGIMTAQAVTKVNGIYTYDFTLVNKIYGGSSGGIEPSPGVWAMAGGSGNTNRQVDNLDKNEVWHNQLGSMGYLQGDYNLSGLVSAADKTDIWQGSSGKASQVPE